MEFETVRSSEHLYQGRILNLRIDQVRTATGADAIREIVEHPGAVAIVPLDDKGQVYLVRQYRHAVGGVTIEVPAGTLEQDEAPLAGARRELREETGLQADRIDRIGGIYPAPAFSTEFIHLYVATGLKPGLAAPEDDEGIELVCVPLTQALEMVRAGSINDGKSASALLLLQGWELTQA